MKKIVSKIHLYLSVPAGLIISVVCLTGAAMVFDKDIHRLCNPHLYEVKEVLAQRLSMIELTDKLPSGKIIKDVQIYPSKSSTYHFSIEGEGRTSFFVDPYTGELLGSRNPFEESGFYRTMFHLHRWLLDYKNGEFSVGRHLVGISTILLIIIIITGVLIWLPRNIKFLKKSLTINVTKGYKRFWYDLHISGGVYATVGALILSITGLMWSYQWYRPMVYSIFGVTSTQHTTPKIATIINAEDRNLLAWDIAISKITAQQKNYTSLSVKDTEIYVYTNSYGNTRAYDTYYFNIYNGSITDVLPYSSKAETSRFMGWMYSIHVGVWGGMAGKIITFIISFIAGILPITGYYLWFKKNMNKKRKCKIICKNK